MADTRVPKSVAKVLLPGKGVVGKTSAFDQAFYATNKRLLGFMKPDPPGVFRLFGFLGLLPGLLWFLSARKRYLDALEYTQISGVSLVPERPAFPVVFIITIGLLVGFMLGGLGVFVIAVGGVLPGVFPLLIGVVAGALIVRTARTRSYWQVELRDQPGSKPLKWRFAGGRGKRLEEQTAFAQLVSEKAVAPGA